MNKKMRRIRRIITLILVFVLSITYLTKSAYAGSGRREYYADYFLYYCEQNAGMTDNMISGQSHVEYVPDGTHDLYIRISGNAWTYNNQVTGYYDQSNSGHGYSLPVSANSYYSGNGYYTDSYVWFASEGPCQLKVYR